MRTFDASTWNSIVLHGRESIKKIQKEEVTKHNKMMGEKDKRGERAKTKKCAAVRLFF
jgi:hypothetical protein